MSVCGTPQSHGRTPGRETARRLGLCPNRTIKFSSPRTENLGNGRQKARFVFSPFKRYRARLNAEPAKSLMVLVVDDDQAVRDFVERVLREAGYRTMVAGSGPEAIELAAKEPIDLLLTDVNMPQMTGDELARRLRHDEPSLKVLYLTGFSDQLFNEKSTLWQDEAYLEKPCTIAGLLQAVALITVGHVQST